MGVVTAEDCISAALIILLAFIGSICQDYVAAFKYQRNISLVRIIFSSVAASIILISVSPFIVNEIGLRGLILVSFVGGLAGFEILCKLCTLDGIIEVLSKVLDIINIARGIDPKKQEGNGNDPPPPNINNDIHIEIDSKKKK